MLEQLKTDLRNYASPEKARVLSSFFRTGKGEYGEGDVFLGVKVPETRIVASAYRDLPLKDIGRLLDSPVHEERVVALLILVKRYEKAVKKQPYLEFYLRHARKVNNWDLVDLTAPKILGAHLVEHPDERGVLRKLAVSKSLWERRIAIVATFALIRNKEYGETLLISKLLLNDPQDLIHKAVGWMLREVGKREEKLLLSFLDQHASKMPRTMLRYAIERLEEGKRKRYLHRSI